MKAHVFVSASLAVLSGCSVAARSPETFRDDTSKILATKNDAIRACYDGVLKSAPNAEGRVTIKFEVETEQGKVSNVTVDNGNSTAPASVTDCVTKNIDGLTLVPPDSRKGQATWVYDFTAPLALIKGPNKT
jgi:hypothetical protein